METWKECPTCGDEDLIICEDTYKNIVMACPHCGRCRRPTKAEQTKIDRCLIHVEKEETTNRRIRLRD
jgi:uncharacterized Zn finger protein